MKLNGWQRLGIVATTAWLMLWVGIGAIGLAAAYHNLADCRAGAAFDRFSGAPLPASVAATIASQCSLFKSTDVAIALSMALAPIAALWVGGAIALKTVRWVTAGFRDNSTDPRA